MRSTCTALLLAAALAGCRNSEADLERLYHAAREDVLRGALTEAVEKIDRAEAAGRPSDWRAALRLLRAEVFLLRSDAPSALEFLNSPVPPSARLAFLEPRRLYLLAQAHVSRQNLRDALHTLEEARRHAAAAGADDVLLDVDVLHGQVLLRKRQFEEGEGILQGVLARAERSRDTYRQALALHNLGTSRLVRNRFDESLAFYDRLLALKGIDEYSVYVTALGNAGLSYARLGQFDRATALQRRALEVHEKRGVPRFLEHTLGELGNTHLLQGEPREARPYLSRAFEVARAANLTADAALWAGNLSAAAVELGDLDEAERYNEEAIRLKALTKGNTTYNALNAAWIALGRGQVSEARRLCREVLDGAGVEPAAQWQAHAGLARAARAAGDADGAARHYDAALQTIQQVRADLLKPEYRMTFPTRVIHFYRDYVETLVDAGRWTRALEVADSSRGVVLAERMGGGVPFQATSANRLPAAAKRAGSVWLAYWLAPRRSYVWVITGSGIHGVELAGTERIGPLVEGYRTMIERSSADPLANPASPGDAVYAAVIAPIARFLPAGAGIRIVPDGVLHNVNFETLPAPGTPRRYWIEDVTIAIAPSLALLAANAERRSPARPDSLLLVGDPTPRLQEFPKLAYAPVEMQAVARHFAGARTVRQDGDRASPQAYASARPASFSVIHFTAHASANHASPLDSAVILAGPPGADKLYARDVAEGALQAELVTISACRSAGERAYAGEGLAGFSWAFLRAGARQVVAGLWDVDDQSTAALMDKLYERVARGERVPSALREAKLALIRRGGNVARPYYWGPFEVFTVVP